MNEFYYHRPTLLNKGEPERLSRYSIGCSGAHRIKTPVLTHSLRSFAALVVFIATGGSLAPPRPPSMNNMYREASLPFASSVGWQRYMISLDRQPKLNQAYCWLAPTPPPTPSPNTVFTNEMIGAKVLCVLHPCVHLADDWLGVKHKLDHFSVGLICSLIGEANRCPANHGLNSTNHVPAETKLSILASHDQATSEARRSASHDHIGNLLPNMLTDGSRF